MAIQKNHIDIYAKVSAPIRVVVFTIGAFASCFPHFLSTNSARGQHDSFESQSSTTRENELNYNLYNAIEIKIRKIIHASILFFSAQGNHVLQCTQIACLALTLPLHFLQKSSLLSINHSQIAICYLDENST